MVRPVVSGDRFTVHRMSGDQPASTGLASGLAPRMAVEHRGRMGPIGALADLVWPLSCAGCAAPGTRWCRPCAAELAGPAWPTSPVPRPAGLPPVWAVSAYDDVVRRAIVGWKDEGRPDLAGPLAQGLARSVRAAVGPGLAAASAGPSARAIWLVPMPSRPQARRSRGADPVRDLAVRAARSVRPDGLDLRVVPAVRHNRAVADQAGLDAGQRAANLAGAFEVHPAWRAGVAGAPCLLVDDIVTTGTTLAQAAAVLAEAAGHPFGAAVVAATQRTHRRTQPISPGAG